MHTIERPAIKSDPEEFATPASRWPADAPAAAGAVPGVSRRRLCRARHPLCAALPRRPAPGWWAGWWLLVFFGAAGPAASGATLTGFTNGWSLPDATLGVQGYVIEDFEDTELAPGLLVEVKAPLLPGYGPTNRLPFVYDPSQDYQALRLFNASLMWDGGHGLVNRPFLPIASYANDGGWSDVIFRFPRGVASVGFSVGQAEHNIVVGVDTGSGQFSQIHNTIPTLPASGARNGYLRVDAGSNEVIHGVRLDNQGGNWDGILYDHLAFKPDWSFTVAASVGPATIARHGTLGAVGALITNQFLRANEQFNASGAFAGRIRFRVTRVYRFDGTADEAVRVPHPNQDYLVHYDADGTNGGWLGGFLAIRHAWPSNSDGGLFGAGATDGLVHELGHARGAIDLYGLRVPAESNWLTGVAYEPERSVMNRPYGERSWDQHSRSLITTNERIVAPPITYITRAFPPAILVEVKDDTGRPVPDLAVHLHPVEWYSGQISPALPLQLGTDANGSLRLPVNPFGPDSPGHPWDIRYPNFLVTVGEAAAPLAGAWMPLTAVQNTHFMSPGEPHVVTLTVPHEYVWTGETGDPRWSAVVIDAAGRRTNWRDREGNAVVPSGRQTNALVVIERNLPADGVIVDQDVEVGILRASGRLVPRARVGIHAWARVESLLLDHDDASVTLFSGTRLDLVGDSEWRRGGIHAALVSDDPVVEIAPEASLTLARPDTSLSLITLINRGRVQQGQNLLDPPVEVRFSRAGVVNLGEWIIGNGRLEGRFGGHVVLDGAEGDGRLTKAGPARAELAIDVRCTNGTVGIRIDDGMLHWLERLGGPAQVEVAATGELRLGGTVQDRVTVAGDGVARMIPGDSLQWGDADATLDLALGDTGGFRMEGGLLGSGQGRVVNRGRFRWTGGVIDTAFFNDSQRFEVGPQTPASAEPPVLKHELRNAGRIRHLPPEGNVQLQDALLVNEATGVQELGDSCVIFDLPETPGVIRNDGGHVLMADDAPGWAWIYCRVEHLADSWISVPEECHLILGGAVVLAGQSEIRVYAHGLLEFQRSWAASGIHRMAGVGRVASATKTEFGTILPGAVVHVELRGVDPAANGFQITDGAVVVAGDPAGHPGSLSIHSNAMVAIGPSFPPPLVPPRLINAGSVENRGLLLLAGGECVNGPGGRLAVLEDGNLGRTGHPDSKLSNDGGDLVMDTRAPVVLAPFELKRGRVDIRSGTVFLGSGQQHAGSGEFLVRSNATLRFIGNAVFHGDYRGTVEGRVIASGRMPLARLRAMEVTQSVQDLDNTVLLVDQKDTLVRCYLDPIGGRISDLSGARLHLTRDGIEPPDSPVGPMNAARAGRDTDTVAGRSNLNATLNFRLPRGWVTGQPKLQLRWTNGVVFSEPAARSAALAPDCSVTPGFVAGPVAQIEFVHVEWKDATGKVWRPNPSTVAGFGPELGGMYPCRQVVALPRAWRWPYSPEPPYLDRLNRVLHALQVAECDDRAIARDPLCLTRLRFGVVAAPPGFDTNSIPGSRTLGLYTPGAVASGQTGVPQVHLHELGHFLGRPHAVDRGLPRSTNGMLRGYCDELARSGAEQFPYFFPLPGGVVPALGPLGSGDDAKVFGYDSRNGRVLDPYRTFELMSYCYGPDGMRWASRHTYSSLFVALVNRFGIEHQPGRRAVRLDAGGPEAWLMIRGSVSAGTPAARLDPILMLPGTRPSLPPEPGEFSVRFLAGDGSVIDEVPFAVEFFTPAGEALSEGGFLVLFPAHPAIRRVQVLHLDRVLTERAAGGSPPLVRVLSLNGGEVVRAGPVELLWEALDPDGDELTYQVQYSPDAGTNWRTLAVDWPQTRYQLDSSELPASPAALLRVIASDGFNSGMDESDAPFRVEDHPPEISFDPGAPGPVVVPGAEFFCGARVHDPDSGPVAEPDIEWTSDRDGFLGRGSEIHRQSAGLSAGVHRITAVFTEPGGARWSATVETLILHEMPRLGFEVAGGRPMIFWPAELPGFRLESNIRIDDDGAWAAVPPGEITVESGRFLYRLPAADHGRFYRLGYHEP